MSAWLVAGAVHLGLAPSASASTQFADSTFNLTDYTEPSIQTGQASISTTQITTGGNPGDALQVVLSIPAIATAFQAVGVFENNRFTWDPVRQGPIQSVDFSLDSFAQTTGFVPPSQGIFAIVAQGTAFYGHSIALPAVLGMYQTGQARGLLAADFSLIDPSSGAVDPTRHPDFTTGVLSFGFASEWSEPAGAPAALVTLRADNFLIDVNTRAISTPAMSPWMASMFAVLLAVGGTVLSRRRGRRDC
jgi:hypothetical protein